MLGGGVEFQLRGIHLARHGLQLSLRVEQLGVPDRLGYRRQQLIQAPEQSTDGLHECAGHGPIVEPGTDKTGPQKWPWRKSPQLRRAVPIYHPTVYSSRPGWTGFSGAGGTQRRRAASAPTTNAE